jgi:hypothetical protein
VNRAFFLRSATVTLALGSAALLGPAGCGISPEVEGLFGGGETGSSSTGGGATASSSGGGSPASSTTTDSGGGATTSSSVSSSSQSSSAVTTTSTTTTTTTTSVTTTSTGPSGPTLDCGPRDCPQGGQSACCWDQYQQAPPPQAECVDGPPESDGCLTELVNGGIETRIECQIPDHCGAGTVCCGERVTFQSNGANYAYYVQLTCQSECNWPDIELCDLGNPICPLVTIDGIPTQTVCKPSGLLPPGYFVCGTP